MKGEQVPEVERIQPPSLVIPLRLAETEVTNLSQVDEPLKVVSF